MVSRVPMLLLPQKSVLSVSCVCSIHIQASHTLIFGSLFLVTEEGRRRHRQSYRCLEGFTGDRPTYDPKPTSQSRCCSYRLRPRHQGSQGYTQLDPTLLQSSDPIPLQSPHETGRRKRTSSILATLPLTRSSILPARCALNRFPRTLPVTSKRFWELPRVLAVPLTVDHHTTSLRGSIRAKSRFQMNKHLCLYIRFRSLYLHLRIF